MEKVNKTSKRFIGELVKLCEGLKLQQLGNSSKFIQRILIFFMQVSKCVCVRAKGHRKEVCDIKAQVVRFTFH